MRWELGEPPLDHPIEEVGLVGHVAVQGHWRHTKPGRHALHGDGIETLEALAREPFCLCRFTRPVGRVRPVPPYGSGPPSWLKAALAAYTTGSFDLLFPTQEQTAVLAAVPERLGAAGVVTAVPPFRALAAVQDKASAMTTLLRLGLPQPPGAIGLAGGDRFPAYVKPRIGTAYDGIRRVASADVIVSAAGPTFIDISPRLVEPNNAWYAGVDLVGAMLDVARGSAPGTRGPGATGIHTHHLLLAVLRAAQQGGGVVGYSRSWSRAGSAAAPAGPVTRSSRPFAGTR
jgi:hypothetical protein